MAVEELPVCRVGALPEEAPEAAWLIEPLWSAQAVGWIAGQPKAGKSWLALDLAISVASGTPCLGHYRVAAPGPALVYLAEDPEPRVRERIAAICRHRDLDLDALPLDVIRVPALQLDQARDQDRLRATVARWRPRLLVLDPLVRLHSLDENHAQEIAALLGYLRALSREHALALVVVHHLTKKARRHPGQALRGSGDLHAWSDSSAYLLRRPGHVLLTLEHRSAPAPDPIPLVLTAGAGGRTPHLERAALVPESAAERVEPLASRLRQILAAASAPLSRTALRRALRVQNHRLGEILADLRARGIVVRVAGGWALASPLRPLSASPSSVSQPTRCLDDYSEEDS